MFQVIKKLIFTLMWFPENTILQFKVFINLFFVLNEFSTDTLIPWCYFGQILFPTFTGKSILWICIGHCYPFISLITVRNTFSTSLTLCGSLFLCRFVFLCTVKKYVRKSNNFWTFLQNSCCLKLQKFIFIFSWKEQINPTIYFVMWKK